MDIPHQGVVDVRARIASAVRMEQRSAECRAKSNGLRLFAVIRIVIQYFEGRAIETA